MLQVLGLEQAELSILLTDDANIRDLNRTHRHKDGPTDVLAFPLDEQQPSRGIRLLGDVVISLDTARRQARARERDLLAEVRFLLAHGLLHLVGYDHRTIRQKREMDAMTRRLVSASPLPVAGPKPVARLRKSRP
jgi:probable rRNA maturation factor